MSIIRHVLTVEQPFLHFSKQLCTCVQHNHTTTSKKRDDGGLSLRDTPGRRVPVWQAVRFAGHSEWQNRKWKKMHIDNKRAKLSGRISLEIIQAVKENGPDPKLNYKLADLIVKAYANNMPKTSVETSIKKALREPDVKMEPRVFQARGPGKAGLLIDTITSNYQRTKSEMIRLLKTNDATIIDDNSVAFAFKHKGVLSVEATTRKGEMSEEEKEEAEEIAIMIGAEEIYFNVDDDDSNTYQFICPPFELREMQKNLTTDYPNLKVLTSQPQYIAHTLMEVGDEHVERVVRLMEKIGDHPDVINVYDNIEGYPSNTLKVPPNI